MRSGVWSSTLVSIHLIDQLEPRRYDVGRIHVETGESAPPTAIAAMNSARATAKSCDFEDACSLPERRESERADRRSEHGDDGNAECCGEVHRARVAAHREVDGREYGLECAQRNGHTAERAGVSIWCGFCVWRFHPEYIPTSLEEGASDLRESLERVRLALSRRSSEKRKARSMASGLADSVLDREIRAFACQRRLVLRRDTHLRVECSERRDRIMARRFRIAERCMRNAAARVDVASQHEQPSREAPRVDRGAGRADSGCVSDGGAAAAWTPLQIDDPRELGVEVGVGR